MDRYFAVVARGIEPIAAKELEAMGATDVQTAPGGVHFSGPREVLYRALLTLRTASRILKPLREFAATTPDIVYSQVRRVVWERYLTPQRTLSVSATAEKPSTTGGRGGKGDRGRSSGRDDRGRSGRDSGRGGSRERGRGPDRGRGSSAGDPPPPPMGGTKWLYNTMFAALKIKDAICDRLKNELGARPDVDKEQPDLVVQAHFSGGRCILSLDASGPSLHERGYRSERGAGGAAPLKETLAAAILQLSEWNGLVPLYDPMCGSGTLVIEAARMALRMPAGGGRTSFACEKWPDFDGTIWAEITTQLRTNQLRKLPAPIYGSDASENQLIVAGDNAFRARIDQSGIRFEQRNVEDAVPPTTEPGILVTNPPYGVRIGDEERLAEFYFKLGTVFRERFKGWIVYVMSGNQELARYLGIRPAVEHKLWNGPLPCRLLKFDLRGEFETFEIPPLPVRREATESSESSSAPTETGSELPKSSEHGSVAGTESSTLGGTSSVAVETETPTREGYQEPVKALVDELHSASRWYDPEFELSEAPVEIVEGERDLTATGDHDADNTASILIATWRDEANRVPTGLDGATAAVGLRKHLDDFIAQSENTGDTHRESATVEVENREPEPSHPKQPLAPPNLDDRDRTNMIEMTLEGDHSATKPTDNTYRPADNLATPSPGFANPWATPFVFDTSIPVPDELPDTP